MNKFEVSGKLGRGRGRFGVKSVQPFSHDRSMGDGGDYQRLVAGEISRRERRRTSHRAFGECRLAMLLTSVRTVLHRHIGGRHGVHRVCSGRRSAHSERHQQHRQKDQQPAHQMGIEPRHRWINDEPCGILSCLAPSIVAEGAFKHWDQQLQFLHVHGLQRHPAPVAQPQFFSVFVSSVFISNLLFCVARKRANHHIASVPWYRVKHFHR